jgi:hypothetical protein
MTARSAERMAAMGGLAFVAVQLAARLLVPTPVLPEVQPGGLVRSYYLKHQELLDVQGVLIGLAVVLGLAFLGALVSFVRRASAEAWLAPVILAAGTLAAGLELASAGALGALVDFRQAEVLGATPENAGGALALFQLYSELRSFAGWPTLALVAAGSFAARSTGAWPGWFTWGGLAFAALGLLDRLVPAISLGDLVLYGFLAWVTLASGYLTRDPGRRASPDGPMASSSA